ncbi:MAG: carboxypeptidase-like regulatory domain-containing protein [Bacteroidetes bacterium]|nr:carboxypeptidase-like regulatory domain-containing protein [Bacteroidota bacterium]
MRILLGFLCICLLPGGVWGQGTVRGTVLDEEGLGAIGALVEIPAMQLGALTNGDGLFAINKIPAGNYRLRVSLFGYDTLYQDVVIENGRVLTLSLYLQTMQLETMVIEEVHGEINRNRPDAGVTKISAKDIMSLPSLGSPDLSQYLQVLPGVVFTGDQGGQLYIRGGTPVQNMTLMDGVIIYNPFHSIGLFSVFDPEYIREVDVHSAGFPAQYGGRVSSIMNIQTRPGSFREFKGKLSTNTLTSGLLLEGPLLPKRGKNLSNGSWLLSARTLYMDQTAKNLYSYANKPMGLPFNFLDLYGKVSLGNGVNRFNAFGFRQQDNVNFSYPSSYNWRSNGGGMSFTLLPENTNLVFSGSLGISNYRTEQNDAVDNFPRYSEVGGFNSRLNFAYLLNSVDEFSFGMQMLGFRTEFEYANSLGLTTQNEDNNTEFAGYFNYRKVFRKRTTLPNGEVNYFSRLVVEPGIRFHYYNDHTYLSSEPRLAAKLNFRGFSLQGMWGLYTQNLMSTVSDRDVVVLFQGYLASPENVPGRQLQHSLQVGTHYMLGLQVDLLTNTELKLEGWYKDFSQLTNVNRQRIFPEDPEFITETGRAYGADVILSYRKRGLYLYGTYGWAFNERDDRTITYHPVWDRRHTVNLVAALNRGEIRHREKGTKLENKWDVSARWTLGSGFPFTQTQGLFEKLNFYSNGSQADLPGQNGSLGVLLSGNYNGARLPYYHRFDISVKRRFLLGKSQVLEVNLNVLNVYNRNNIFYFDRILYERVDQLPIMPTAGLIWSF